MGASVLRFLLSVVLLAAFPQPAGADDALRALVQRILTAQNAIELEESLPDAFQAELRKGSAAARAQLLQSTFEPFLYYRRPRTRPELVNEGEVLLKIPSALGDYSTEVRILRQVIAGDSAVILLGWCLPTRACEGSMTIWATRESGFWKLASIDSAAGHGFTRTFDYPEMDGKLTEKEESEAKWRLHDCLDAIGNYQKEWPAIGLPQSLTDLGGYEEAEEATPDAAHLLRDDLACPDIECSSGGYAFSYRRLGGGRFELTAVPMNGHYGRKSFFTDESGKIRFTTEGRPATAKDPVVD